MQPCKHTDSQLAVLYCDVCKAKEDAVCDQCREPCKRKYLHLACRDCHRPMNLCPRCHQCLTCYYKMNSTISENFRHDRVLQQAALEEFNRLKPQQAAISTVTNSERDQLFRFSIGHPATFIDEKQWISKFSKKCHFFSEQTVWGKRVDWWMELHSTRKAYFWFRTVTETYQLVAHLWELWTFQRNSSVRYEVDNRIAHRNLFQLNNS